MTQKKPHHKLSVIGCGKVGKTLAALFYSRGVFCIESIINRTIESGREAAEFIGAGKASIDFADARGSSVIMISVPDDEIHSCAQKLADCECVTPGTVVFHCSGFCSSDVLEPLKARGCITASIHPVKSFSDPKSAYDNFDKTPCALEGREPVLRFLTQSLNAIGGDVFVIEAKNKPLYHSAAVFLNNYIVALMNSSLILLKKSGLDDEQSNAVAKALAPAAVDNVLQFGAASSLTGPIIRGDIETVGKEIEALSTQCGQYGKDFSDLYKILGKAALSLAIQSGKLSDSQINQLNRCLNIV
ncbi:MAG: DUF2520 domain-containing protein [Chitinispirillia bacterium]|nr:DUF2520 domain-containing protein [Chitinispirillia bacterium]